MKFKVLIIQDKRGRTRYAVRRPDCNNRLPNKAGKRFLAACGHNLCTEFTDHRTAFAMAQELFVPPRRDWQEQ